MFAAHPLSGVGPGAFGWHYFLDQKIASGYNRCLVTTGEGGSIPEEYEAIYAKDRVETMSTDGATHARRAIAGHANSLSIWRLRSCRRP